MAKLYPYFCCWILIAFFCLLMPGRAAAFEVERFYLDFSGAPPHNEVVGIDEVDRVRIQLGLRFSFVETKEGLGIFGGELMPNYYFGGYWPKQTDKWGSGEVQRLEIRYRVFLRPLKWLEFYAEHYENVITKDGKLDGRGYNQFLHNLFGFRIWIVDKMP